MFYDEKGKHVRTKIEILDENGELSPGCSILRKGEIYEEHLFDKKISKFKEKNFNDEVKHLYAEKMNERIAVTGYKMTVFDKNVPYLPTEKIGKNNPMETVGRLMGRIEIEDGEIGIDCKGKNIYSLCIICSS